MTFTKLKIYNLPREICHHAIGKEHTHSHRMVAGTCIMLVGVAIAKSAHFFDATLIHFSMDMVGYAVHGLGALPFIEYVME